MSAHSSSPRQIKVLGCLRIMFVFFFLKKHKTQRFLGSPVIKTQGSQCAGGGGVGAGSPARARSHMPSGTVYK